MDAVDAYIPEPVRQLDKPFLMPIEDVFSIQVNYRLIEFLIMIYDYALLFLYPSLCIICFLFLIYFSLFEVGNVNPEQIDD